MTASQKMIVKSIATALFLLKNSTDNICPKIAPINDITMMMMELFGVLWKILTPISSIFNPIAVEMARNALIGKSSQIYFLVIPRTFGSVCFNVCRNDPHSKCLS